MAEQQQETLAPTLTPTPEQSETPWWMWGLIIGGSVIAVSLYTQDDHIDENE